MEKRRIFVKKTRLHINYVERTGDRDYSNRTKILLFIPGMLFFDINSIEGEVNGQEAYTSSFITEKGIDTAFFNWNHHSKSVKNWKKLKIQNYMKELKAIIDYLKSIGYSTIYIKCASFGSVSLIRLLDNYNYSLNIKKIVIEGANFSAAAKFLSRQLEINKFWKRISPKSKIRLLNSYKITRDYKNIKFKNSYDISFFVGELENEKIKSEIQHFSENNNCKIVNFKGEGHTVYNSSKMSLDKYNHQLLKEFNIY